MTSVEWVVLPLKDKQRPSYAFTEYVQIQDGLMYGFGRSRSHWISTDMPDGAYDPVSFDPIPTGAPSRNFLKLQEMTRTDRDLHVIDSDVITALSGKNVILPNGSVVNQALLRESMNGDSCLYLAYETSGERIRLFGVSEFGGFCILEEIDACL